MFMVKTSIFLIILISAERARGNLPQAALEYNMAEEQREIQKVDIEG